MNRPPASTLLAWTALACSAVVAFHGALGGFFCQDDFAQLARARGIVGSSPGIWRLLSHSVFFGLMNRLAGLRAPAYFAVLLGLHIVTASLLLLVLRRAVSPWAAWIGATFFTVHPAMFRALYWVSAVGDEMALAFVLAAWLMASRTDRRRWLALPLFALSLLSKEVTLLWPVVLVADRMWRDFRNFPNESRDAGAIARREWRALRCAIRDPLVLATLGVAVLFGCGLWATGGVLGHDALLGSDASYSLAWDLSAARNFLTYAGWTVKIFVTTLRSGYDVYIYDTIQPQVFVAGASLIFAALAGLWIPALRRRGWMVACTTYAAFLLPAIPLGHHTFHYYLYPALAGAAWGVAAIADLAWRKTPALTPGKAAALAYTAPPRRLAERRTPSDRAAGGPRTLSWLRGSTAILTVMGLTWNGAAYMHHLESSRLPDARLPTDPTLRRQLIARHVRDALLGAHLPAGTRLYFWSPASLRMDRALGRAARSGPSQVTLWERNVEAALEGELGVRVLLPAVQQVKFVHSYELAPAGVLYAIYDVDGTLELMPAAQIELYAREQRGGR